MSKVYSDLIKIPLVPAATRAHINKQLHIYILEFLAVSFF